MGKLDDLRMHINGMENRQKMLILAGMGLCLVAAVSLVVLAVLLVVMDGSDESVNPDYHASVGANGAVASDVSLCSSMGITVLQDLNGNAVDAAVTVALCLGLINSQSSGVGGGGVILIRPPGIAATPTLFDFREVAPKAASQNMFVGNPMASRIGPLAVAVPGELAGLEKAHARFGKLSWATVIEPVAKLADEGFEAPGHLVKALQSMQDCVMADAGLRSVYAPNGELIEEGATVKRPQFAATLRRVAQNGAGEFYLRNYTTAQNLVTDLTALGGIVTADDLERYYTKGVIERKPVEIFYEGYQVLTSPPPFGGIVMAMALNLVEFYNFALLGLTGLSYQWLTECLKFAYADRMALGDPDFQPANFSNVVDAMTSKYHAMQLRSRLFADKSFGYTYYQDQVPLTSPNQDHGTTHFSVVDSDRMVVAMTSTVNLYFGACIMSPSTGVVYNDEMDDFSTPNVSNAFNLPPSRANFIAPYKRPQSSMTPTIVVKNGAPVLTVGASGGSLIPTGTMQVLLNTLMHGMDVLDAISYPRIHEQLLPEEVQVEEAMPEGVPSYLQNAGQNVRMVYHVDVAVQAIFLDDQGLLHAASDPRKGGQSAAY